MDEKLTKTWPEFWDKNLTVVFLFAMALLAAAFMPSKCSGTVDMKEGSVKQAEVKP